MHYSDVIMSAMGSQITGVSIFYSTAVTNAFQRKYQSSASLAFVRGVSPVTGKFPAQKASNAEFFSIWWRHHGVTIWATLYGSLGARNMYIQKNLPICQRNLCKYIILYIYDYVNQILNFQRQYSRFVARLINTCNYPSPSSVWSRSIGGLAWSVEAYKSSIREYCGQKEVIFSPRS